VLAALALGGRIPVSRLAVALGIERTTLTRSTAILEWRGWAESDASGDARVRPIKLTRSGRCKLEAAFPAWKAAQELVGGDSRRSELARGAPPAALPRRD
jgi:DNA-binding MarR family transcriptional regulator